MSPLLDVLIAVISEGVVALTARDGGFDDGGGGIRFRYRCELEEARRLADALVARADEAEGR